MDSRSMVVVMLVGAALVVPNVSAGGLVGGLEVRAPDQQRLAALGEDAVAPVEAAAAPVLDVLECRDAIRLPVSVYGGWIRAVNHPTADLLDQRTVTAPVAELTSTLEASPVANLFAALPVAEATTTVTEMTTTVVDLVAHIEWEETYREYERLDFDVLLSLPIGLDFLGAGGFLVRACEGELIHTSMPDWNAAFAHYDLLKVVVGDDERYDPTGWYLQLLDIRVRMADGQDKAANADRWSIGPSDFVDTIAAALDLYAAGLTGEQLAGYDDAPAEGTAPEGASLEISGGGTVTVPALSWAAIAFGIVAALGAVMMLAGGLGLRRSR